MTNEIKEISKRKRKNNRVNQYCKNQINNNLIK